MEHWEGIQLRCVRDVEPIKRVARDLGLSPNNLRKYRAQMESPQLPRYEGLNGTANSTRLPKIDALLESTPKITVKRIGAIICQQHDPKLIISQAAPR